MTTAQKPLGPHRSQSMRGLWCVRVGDELGHEWLTSSGWYRRFGAASPEGLSPEVEHVYAYVPHQHVLYFTSKQTAAGAYVLFKDADGMDEPMFPIQESVNYIEQDGSGRLSRAFVRGHHPEGLGGPHYLLEAEGHVKPVVAAHDEVYLWRP